jgi:uncharacterized protein YPO0396
MKTVLVEEEYYHGLQNMACNAKARLAIAQAKLEEAQQRIEVLEALCRAALEGIDDYWRTLPQNNQTMRALENIASHVPKGSDDDR